jgi:hypothetical protein
MSGEAVLENVRRYRTIASLYRQTAAFRPLQRCSLLGQAELWEHLAVNELEAYFRLRDIAPATGCRRSLGKAGSSGKCLPPRKYA